MSVTIDVEAAVRRALGEEMERARKEIISRHVQQANKEFERAITGMVARAVTEVARIYELQTLTDRVIITVHRPGQRDRE